jgi:glyoxylate reductase
MLIAITRQIPDAGIKLLKAKKYQLRMNTKDRPLTPNELRNFVKDADAILSLLTDRIDGNVMDAAGKQLKIIANYAVGYDNIIVEDAKRRGILVTNTPGTLENSVAEHTFALILSCAKRIVEADFYTRHEQYKAWNPTLFLGMELSGKTLGVVGLGRIGVRVAEMAMRGMRMKIVYSDMRRNETFEKEYDAKFLSLPMLLKKSDVVTLHVPLLPSTRHLISTKQFQMMKNGAILINTARGPIVDEKALLHALKRKNIMSVGLDVFECEPAIDCDIRDDLELKAFRNAIMTPHIASATIEARQEMSRIAAQNIIAVLGGKKALSAV